MRTYNRAEAIHRGRWLGIAVILVLSIFAAISDASAQTHARWKQSVTVTYDDPRLIPHLTYAVWSLSERTGHPVSLGWQASAVDRGRIHVSVIPDREMYARRGTYTTVAYVQRYTFARDRAEMAQAEMFIRESVIGSACELRVVVHEMEHAMGVSGHADDKHDVMYPSMDFCLLDRHTLSRGDMNLLMKAGYDVNFCWAELTKDGDLYIPAIAGFSVELRSHGEGWKIGGAQGGGHCSGSVDGNLVTLKDIRSPTERYKAEMYMDGENLTLISAESVRQRSAVALSQSYVDHGPLFQLEVVE